MKPTRLRHRRPPARLHPRKRGAAAFTLIELSVVLLLISIVAALAAPYLKRAQLNARSTAVINDLRVFAAGLQAYAQERGDWPPGEVAPGTLPAGTQQHLGQTNWARVTPIGGFYTWSPDTRQQGERYRAAITFASVGENNVTSDRNQLEDIDRKFDDGDLGTGVFRLGYRNQPVFVIER